MRLRIGFGYDLHPLSQGRPLFLGGIEIPHPKGLEGHSDGDCLIHALVDAILGALGEPDIGSRFPDTDPATKDIRSTLLLEGAARLLKERGAVVVNLDSVILAEQPKLASHIPRMKKAMAGILGIPVEDVGIKAKSGEGIGCIGEEDAVAAWAVVLIEMP